jgi:hypothetical protein
MSQVQPGDDGSGRRPGSQPPKGSPAKRPPAKAAPKPGSGAKGRPPTTGAAKGRPPSGGGRPPGGGKGRPPAAGGAKGRAPRQNMKINAPPPRRFSPSTLAFVSIGVVVVIVLVFVIVKVTSSSPSKANGPVLIAAPVPASASVVAQVTGVPTSVLNTVGTGSGVSPPSVVKNQPKLTANGKPEMLFIGAEFCPFCAAERWAMVVALSRFGTWSGLEETTSSLWDSDPGTATFTFRDATMTSPYVDFVSVEHETNDNRGEGTRTLFQPLTKAQTNLWTKYSAKFGETTGYPFVDFGNKVFVIGPSYNPALLAGLDQPEIAAKLTNPKDPVTQAILGTANYLTAAICAETGNTPASVCTQSGVHKAAVSLKLS